MFKRMIPLASAALLLFSCGGSKTTAIDLDQLTKPTHGSYFLASKEIEIKKGKTFSFAASLENFEKEQGGHEYVSTSTFLLAKNGSTDRLETIDAIDTIKSATYNGKKLTCYCNDPDDTVKVPEWYSKIQSKSAEVDDTYVVWNIPTEPKTKVFMVNHYDSKSTDKFSITITTNQDATCIGAFSNNDNM